MLTNLKKLREDASISQKALADAIGVSQQSVNKYENHNVEPDIGALIRIADCFSTSVDYIIGHTEERYPIAPLSTYSMDNEDFVLLQRYRKLSEKQKACVNLLIETYNE